MDKETTENANDSAVSGSRQERAVMRQDLIDRVIEQREEILQLFADVAHWNESRTRFEHVDPDPDGEMARLLIGLEKCLENEGLLKKCCCGGMKLKKECAFCGAWGV
jgi:hypothetical protein